MTVTTIDAVNIGYNNGIVSQSNWNASGAWGGGTIFGPQGGMEAGNYAYDGGSALVYGGKMGFLAFDTSVIPDDDEIVSVQLQMKLMSYSGDPGECKVRQCMWGPTLDTGDWYQLDIQVASSTALHGGLTGQYHTFTSYPTFLEVNGMKTGWVYLAVTTARWEEQRTGSINQFHVIQFYKAYDGPSDAPKLVITHIAAGPPIETLAASIPVELDIGGELADVAPSLTSALPVAIGLGAALGDAPLAPTWVAGDLPLVITLGGSLSTVQETLKEVQGSLDVLIGIGGTVGFPPVYQPPRPLRRSVSEPYKRTSISRVYRNQFRSRRW